MSNANIFTCPSIFISSLTTQAKSRLPKCGGPEAAAIPDPPTCVKCRQRVAIEPCRDTRNKFKQIVSFWELGRCLSRKELFLAHTRNKLFWKRIKRNSEIICCSQWRFASLGSSFSLENDARVLKFLTISLLSFDRIWSWNFQRLKNTKIDDLLGTIVAAFLLKKSLKLRLGLISTY